MSIKLYNGLKPTKRDISVWEVVEDIRSTIDPIFATKALRVSNAIGEQVQRRKLDTGELLTMTVREVMESDEYPDVPYRGESLSAAKTIHHLFASTTHNFDAGQHDIGWECVLMRNMVDGEPPLVRVVSSNEMVEKYMDALIGSGRFKDFCYWNNTDYIPDGVSEDDWRRRYVEWGLDRLTFPVERLVSVKMPSLYGICSVIDGERRKREEE